MDRDPYQLCPCGSGNKLKFCCADVASEMDKIERLLSNNQRRMALQGLEKLYETHPDSQWVRTVLGMALINEDRSDEAKKVLAGLLKAHPQQPFGNALYALAAFNADGYPASKRAVHRAFKQSTHAYPELISTLTTAIADQLEAQEATMAARQYRVLSLRLTTEEMRRELFSDLLALDSEKSVAYPLRSVRHPENLAFDGDDQNTVQLANRYSAVGCWEEAADELQRLTETHADNASLWYNIGLYRAWDADHPRAAEAFRKASHAEDDFDRAVEYEVLAQSLERLIPERGRQLRLKRFNVSSVSQVLSRLDQTERVQRIKHRDDGNAAGQFNGVAGLYLILNRTLSEDEDYSQWNCDSVPLIEGRLTIFEQDEQSDQPAQAFLVGLEGDELDRAMEVVQEAVGGLLEPVTADDEEESQSEVTGYFPPEELALRWSGYLPAGIPAEVARRIAEQNWQRIIHDVWANHPMEALGGRTPLECVGDESVKVPLAAALIVLDAYADSREYILEIDDLRERFQIDPPRPFPVDEQTNINLLSILQIQRLPLKELTTEQFEQVIKRATLVRHGRLVYDVMREALERPEISSDFERRGSILTTLSQICGHSLRREESLNWIAQGLELAEGRPHSFEAVLEWKMLELATRINDPEDSRLKPLLEDLWQNYGAKLPQLREYLVNLTEAAGVTPPWESAIVTPAGVGGGGDRWGGASEPAAASERKLWLPGSD